MEDNLPGRKTASFRAPARVLLCSRGGRGVGGMGRSIAVCLYSSFCMFPFCCGKATVMKRNDRADRRQRTQGKWAIFCARRSGNYDNMDMENEDRARADSFRKAQKRAKKTWQRLVNRPQVACARIVNVRQVAKNVCTCVCVRTCRWVGGVCSRQTPD